MSLLWGDFIERLDAGLDLEAAEVQSVLQAILEDTADIESVKAFLLAFHKKGETAEEVTALVEQLYLNAMPISITDRAVDTVGTGGDGAREDRRGDRRERSHCRACPSRFRQGGMGRRAGGGGDL